MRNENTETPTPTPTPIDTAQLENVTGGCNGLGGCVNCGETGTSKDWTRRDEQ